MHPPLEGVIHQACPHRFVELAHTVVTLLTVCPVNQNMDSNRHNICHKTQLHINGNLLESVMLYYGMPCYVTLSCYFTLCLRYFMLRYVMLCNVTLPYAILCYVMLRYFRLCYVMLRYVIYSTVIKGEDP